MTELNRGGMSLLSQSCWWYLPSASVVFLNIGDDGLVGGGDCYCCSEWAESFRFGLKALQNVEKLHTYCTGNRLLCQAGCV